MPNCAVAKCTNNNKNMKNPNIKFHRFPRNEKLAKQWVIACRREDEINLKYATICSIHFEEKYSEIPLKQRLLNYVPKSARNLKDDAVPTLFLPGGLSGCVNKRQSKERNSRIAAKRRRKEVKEILLSASTSSSTSAPKNAHNLKDDSVPTLILPGGLSGCVYKRQSEERTLTIAAKRLKKEIISSASTLIISEIPSTETITGKSKLMNVEEKSTQTSPNDNREQSELEKLKKQVEILELQNKNLLQQIEETKSSTSKKYITILEKVFTPGQIRKLLNSNQNKKVRWSTEDIASAISLRSISSRAYRYLKANNYPLPAMSTLRSWAGNFDINEGILKGVITLMNKKSSDLCALDRLCVITFDEIYISSKKDIEKKTEMVFGTHSSCQTVMVRGLISNWKQPIYYTFDKPMLKETLEEIISELFRANYIVVAISSDMGGGNMSLWKKLNIGYDKSCHIVHPCDESLKIFCFADVPNLMKLVRKHLIDQGFMIDNKVINVDYFNALLNISTSESTIVHKLTQQHLNVKGSMKQRVLPAVQLLSNSVAKAMKYCGEKGLMPKDYYWKDASEMIQLFNNWFDLFNSHSKLTQNYPGKNAYGTDVDNQKNILDRMTTFIKHMRVGTHKELIPFQKGILLSSESLSELYSYLNGKYGLEYILTSRLNKDVLYNFFSHITGMGENNDHPSALDFRYKLRWYILGKHSASIFAENQTTESDEEEICLTHELLSNLSNRNKIPKKKVLQKTK